MPEIYNGGREQGLHANDGESQDVYGQELILDLPGVAVAGADYVKCGFAGLDPKAAAYLGRNLVRTVKEWRPECKVYPAVFPEEEFVVSFDPLTDGPVLVETTGSDGLLKDTYNKGLGKGLLDYYDVNQLAALVANLHARGKEAWLAGSITANELPELWQTGVDVICVRAAACVPSAQGARFGAVSFEVVAKLVKHTALGA